MRTPYESDEASSEVQAISTDDGSTLGSTKAGYPVQMLDGGILFAGENGLTELDTDGHEKWSATTGDNWALSTGQAYSLDDDQLTAIDLSNGEKVWSVDTDLSCGDDYCSLASGDDFVVVADSDVAKSFSRDDGTSGWSETLAEEGSARVPRYCRARAGIFRRGPGFSRSGRRPLAATVEELGSWRSRPR